MKRNGKRSKGLRFQTHFGVAIPPWKEEVLGAGATTIRFVLKGNVISKKNNQQAIAVRKPAVSFLHEVVKQSPHPGYVSLADALRAVHRVKGKMRGNEQYKKFLERMKPVIQAQMAVWIERLQDKGLTFPLPKASITTRLYIKDRYRRDSANAQQTIQDLLVDCKVLSDDDDAHLNPITATSARYYEELVHNIAFISLSFRLDRPADPDDERVPEPDGVYFLSGDDVPTVDELMAHVTDEAPEPMWDGTGNPMAIPAAGEVVTVTIRKEDHLG